MKDIKVSVIMPVYNAAEYLSRTLDDVTNQTLRDIQIICVDDGSKDNSREIVKEYQKKDERIQLVEQENKNAGAARNHGMQYAKGKYVVFWDSDDLFLENALETMYLQAEKTQADICICAARRYDNQTGKYFSSDAYLRLDYLPEKEVFQKTDIPDHIFNLATNVPWNKMFLRSFIIENHLEFQEIRQANDTFFTLSAFYFAKRISYVTDVLISYRVNSEQSLSGKASDTVFCAYDSYCKTKELLEKQPDYELVRRSFLNRAISGFYHALNIQTNFASYQMLYEKLVKEGFEEFGLTKCTEDFFFDSWMYTDMHNMLEWAPGDFLVQKSMVRRLNVEKANAQKKELNAKLAAKTEKIESKDRRIEKLNARIQELKDKNYEIMNTKRYKVASFFAKPFEWFRKRNAEPEEKE